MIELAWSISKEDTISLQYPLSTVFDVVPNVLQKLNWKVDRMDRPLGRFRVKIGMSLWTWGQTMFIDLNKIDDQTTKVQVYSEAGGQKFDWGKNRRDIESFLRELEATLQVPR